MPKPRIAFFLTSLLLAATPALAAGCGLRGLSGVTGDRYQHCIELTKQDAQAAYYQALAWHSSGGGMAAEHCGALALVQLDRYAEAAPKLETLARDSSLQPAERAQLFDQAGNIWLLAEDPQNAELDFSSALANTANDVDILADRSRARAMRKNWAGADADLSAALAQFFRIA